jgi:cytochrome c biogenesis factor
VIALGAVLLARKEPQSQGAGGGDRLIGFALGIASTYAIALIAAVGMSVPFFSAIFGRFDDQGKARVIEQATYNRIVPYAFIPLMLLMAIVPFLGWTKTQTKRWADLASIGVASLLYSGAAIWYLRSQGLFDQRSPNLLVLLSVIVFLCVSSIIANLWRTFESARKRGRWAPFAMHTGVSLLLMGLIVSSAFEREVKSFVSVTRPAQMQAGPKAFLVRLERTPSLSEWVRPENRLKVELTDLRSQSTDLRAEVSHYFKMDSDDGEPMLVTRPAIFGSPLYDLYLSVSSPITTFGNSISLMPGRSGEIQNIKIEYQKFVMHGQPGMSGTRFGTKLKVVYDAKTFDAEPELVLDRGNAVRVPAPAGDDFVVVLESVQAGSHEATFSVQFSEPILPIELYYKPLTILVWIGAGMMALGGFLTMLQVRSSAKPAGKSDATDSTP